MIKYRFQSNWFLVGGGFFFFFFVPDHKEYMYRKKEREKQRKKGKKGTQEGLKKERKSMILPWKLYFCNSEAQFQKSTVVYKTEAGRSSFHRE